MKRKYLARVLPLLAALLIARHLLAPPVLRVHTIDWTYSAETGRAVAGTTLFPFVILLDVGPEGDAALEHELCHWHNALTGQRYATAWDAELACGQDAPREWYANR
jgi:hypothetical protein